MIVVPQDRLSDTALTNLIEDFVSREGRNHDQDQFSVAQMADQVRRQLKNGKLVIVFDEKLGSCSILPREQLADES